MLQPGRTEESLDDLKGAPSAVKRMTMASSPEGLRPSWDTGSSPSRTRQAMAKEKCKRCDEWQRKFREQNVSYFRESGHFQHAIKKLLVRCSESMPDKQYRQLEASLQLDVRFFSEHSNADMDFTEDSPAIRRNDDDAMATLQERIAALEQENEGQQKQIEELEAAARANADAAARRNMMIRPTTAAETVLKVEAHCQTDQLAPRSARSASSYQESENYVDPSSLVKKELDKVTASRDALASSLQAAQRDHKAVINERNELERKVRELQQSLEAKFSTNVPGVQVPMAAAAALKADRRAKKAALDAQATAEKGRKPPPQVDLPLRPFSEQVAESDARVQGTVEVEAVLDQEDSTPSSAGLDVEDGTAADDLTVHASLDAVTVSAIEAGISMEVAVQAGTPKGSADIDKEADLKDRSLADASTRLFQERHASMQTDPPPETANFSMQVKEWDLDGGGTVRLRANQSAEAQEKIKTEVTRKTKAFGKQVKEAPKLGFGGGGVGGGGGPVPPSVQSSASTTASTTATTGMGQSGYAGGEVVKGGTQYQKLPALAQPSHGHGAPGQPPPGVQSAPVQKQAWQGEGGKPLASSASAGFLPTVPSAPGSAGSQMGSSRSAAELGAHGAFPPGPPPGGAAPGGAPVPQGRAPSMSPGQSPRPEMSPGRGGPAAAGGAGPRSKKKSKKPKEKEPEPYLYEVWEKYPDSHKKPSDTELLKLGAHKPLPPESVPSSEQGTGAGSTGP